MSPKNTTDMTGKQLRHKFSALKRANNFSRLQLIVFVLAFGVIGYLLIKAFATAPLVASLEAEQMSLPTGGSVINDSLASAGKAIKYTQNGSAVGTVNFPSPVTSLNVVARGDQCSGAPTMIVWIDGINLATITVSSTTWTSYSVGTSSAFNSGSHNLSVSFTNAYSTSTYKGNSGKIRGTCSRNLYLDVTNFYGPTPAPTPAPTVTLSASPTSLTAGQSSTLTWNSTNADSCSASGAWSGPEPTSGSASTGALNQSSTYSLTCTGSGGSATASATVMVTSSGGTTGVTPPAPPSAYTLPSNAVAVSTTSGLLSALGGSTTDIILENGDYTNTADVGIGVHHLWARNLGGATLHFGLEIGGNSGGSGGQVHGIKFDVTDPSLTLQGAIINIWGATAGQNAVVADSWFYGHGSLDSGILSRITSGLKVQRVVVSGFQSYGVYFETYYPGYYTDNPPVVPVVSDADISAINRPVPGSSNGTAEAGLWAGTNCLCSNIKTRNTGVMGIWTGGNANNGTYSNFDIDGTPTGVYLEHYSRSNVFKNFVIGNSASTGVRIGFVCEWADPAYAGTNPVSGQSISACHFNTMQDGTIYSSYLGFELEDAESTTIQRIKFAGQTNAGIDDFMTSGTGYSTIWQNLGNDFSGLAPGALQYSTAH